MKFYLDDLTLWPDITEVALEENVPFGFGRLDGSSKDQSMPDEKCPRSLPQVGDDDLELHDLPTGKFHRLGWPPDQLLTWLKTFFSSGFCFHVGKI